MKYRKHSIMSLLLILVVGISVTMSLLISHTDPLINEFKPGDVPPEIIEKLEGNVKKEVQVQNQGNVSAYIRVFLAANFIDQDENVLNIDASLPEITSEDWFEHQGYYYYKHIVEPGALTTFLFTDFEMPVVEGNDSAIYELQILASSVQADPTEAVESLWPVRVIEGKLEGVRP